MLQDWIRPTQSRKAGEIAIGGVQHASVFDSQRGQLRVTDQIAGSLAFYQHFAKERPMLLSRAKRVHIRLLQPAFDNFDGSCCGQGTS
jgi:hypothetical protein